MIIKQKYLQFEKDTHSILSKAILVAYTMSLATICNLNMTATIRFTCSDS